MIEPLESRLLMTRVIGSGSFEYLAGDDETIIRVTYSNVTAEFLFADVDGTSNDVDIRRQFIVPPGEGDDDVPGRDLFAVYVRESNLDSYISIAAVPSLDEDDRPMQPFIEGIGTLRVNSAQNGKLTEIGAADGTGKVLLGARTRDLEDSDAENEDMIPIVEKNLDGDDDLGIMPAPDDGILRPGLLVDRGRDFGRFLLGGTVMGTVEFTGSVETFYAGWLLTGDAKGIGETEDSDTNFTVAGDIHNLIVKDSIGTDVDTGDTEPGYVTGFDMRVEGRIGQVRAYNSIIGTVNAIHASDAPTIRGQTEVEERTKTDGSSTTFQDGNLGDDATLNNDTFATAQYLGSFENSGGDNIIRLSGAIQNDTETASPADAADYYGVALMAGQTITFQLEQGFGFLSIGVYDPDGRLVASDYDSSGGKIRYTADRPGVHRIAVAVKGDADFNGAGGEFQTDDAVINYRFRVQGVGDMAVGAIAATGGIFDRGATGRGFFARRGDFGALVSEARVTSQSLETMFVQRGDLRAIEAGDLGALVNGLFGAGPNINVPRGSVGLLRATAAGGVMSINDPFRDSQVPAIGGDYQLVESRGVLHARLVANGDIGVIRADNMAVETDRSYFKVNADKVGPAGTIDLIDVTGDFGTLEAGGPAIETGPGGNVRYINVGGEVFQDQEVFGNGQGSETVYEPGERVDLTDDSGSSFTIKPTRRPNPNFNSTNPLSPQFLNIGALTVSTYGIRDKGGVVLLNVSSTEGLEIDASGRSVEISRIDANGPGTAIIDTLLTNKLRFALAGRKLDVLLDGSATIDVFNVTGGQFTNIINSTGGEIVNADITSVGTLSARTLGLAKNATGAAVNGIAQKSNVYPFLDQRNTIDISGNAIEIASENGLGNIVVGGIVQELTANSNGSSTSAFEGINAPVQVTGELREVNIGEGIAYSGNGNVAHSGIFVDDAIGTIRGSNADIRGDVISKESIDSIQLRNGSIINTDIAVIDDFADGRQFRTDFLSIDSPLGTFTDPFYELGSIELSGNGGIIGTVVRAYDIGPVTVDGGFGILQSTFNTPGLGQIETLSTDGYGVRNVFIDGGTNFAGIQANGTGSSVGTNNYSKSVRQSEHGSIDPYFGMEPSAQTDLHEFLGTSKKRPKIKNVTKTGVIENTEALFSRGIEQINAHVIRGNSRFNAANSIDSLVSRNGVNRMSVRSGSVGELRIGGNAKNADVRIAGRISSAFIDGDLVNGSFISATGIDGVIESLNITRDALGDVEASVQVSTLTVGRDFGGNLSIVGDSRDAVALSSMTVGRDFVNGSIDITGKVNNIKVGRDFGQNRETVRIVGAVNMLKVGRNLFSDIRVRRDIGNLDVGRSVLSDSLITVDRDLDSLVIGRDLEAGAVITVGRNLGTKQIGGDELGDVIEG
jgi:hypothetical protein